MCPIPTCVKQFTSCRGHDLHVSKHSEPEKFRCDNCSYVCQDKDSLRAHTMEHSMSRRYPCSYCSKHFGRSNDCKRHELKCPAITESSQCAVKETSIENTKNKCKNTEPMKYVKLMSEVNVVVPKNKAGVPTKKNIDIVCDMCEINFESFTDLGEHVTKKHQRKKNCVAVLVMVNFLPKWT